MQIKDSSTAIGDEDINDSVLPATEVPADVINSAETKDHKKATAIPDRSVSAIPMRVEMDMESEEGQKVGDEARRITTEHFVNNLPMADKFALNVMGVTTGLVEDTYNAVADTVNYISKNIGGQRVLDNMNVVSSLMPTDAVSETTREITKFVVGYGLLAGKAKAIMQPQSKLAQRSVEAGAGMMADFTINSPDTESLLSGLLTSLPIGDSVIQFIESDQSAPFEKRLRNSIFGIAEGALAEGLFKAVTAIGKVKRAGRITADVMENPKLADEVVEEVPVPKEGDVLPDIPVEADDLPPMTLPDGTELTESFITTAKKLKAGEGRVNSRDMVLEDGTKVHINLAKMNKPDDFRKAVDGLVTANPKMYSKEVISDKQTAKIAASYDMTPAQLLEWEEKSGLHRGQVLASMDIADESVGAFNNTVKRFNEGSATKEEGALAMARATEYDAKSKDLLHLAGSLLHEASIDSAKVKSIRDFKKYKEIFGDDFEQIAKVMKESNVGSSDIARAFAKRSLIKTGDLLTQIRYTSMLSNPATHARNIFGTGANTMLRSGESVLAASINAINPKIGGVTFGDAYHEGMGMAQGLMEAIQITGKKMRGVPADFRGVDPKKAKLSEAMTDGTVKAKSPIGKAVEFMNHEILQGRSVGRALVFEDNFMKHINARMTMNREAFRAARLSGKKGEEFQEIFQKNMIEPSDATLKKMYKDAEDATLTGDVEGQTFKALQQLGESPVGKIIAPFAKINLNAMTYKLERIPGLNLTMKHMREEFASIDPSVRQRAQAKMSLASTTMAGLGFWLHGSDSITGTGPKESKKWQMFEQQGRIQGAIRIGDEWVEYRRETPMGSILGMVADIAELRDVSEGNSTIVEDASAAMTSIIAGIYTPEFLVDNGSKLMEAMAKGDVSAANKMIGATADIATTFFPYTALARHANRQLQEAGEIKREVTDPTSIYNTFINKLWNIYAPDRLAIKRNILGAPIYHKHGLGPDIVTPFGVSSEVDNPVIKELARLSGTNNIVNPNTALRAEAGLGDEYLTVQMPPRVINKDFNGESVSYQMRPHEYEKFVKYAAGIHKYYGKHTLEYTLKTLMKTDTYKSSALKEQGVMVGKQIQKYRVNAKKLWLADNQEKVTESADKVKKVIKTRMQGF